MSEYEVLPKSAGEQEVLPKRAYERPSKLGDKLVELKSRLVSTTIRDISPDGIRLEVNSRGRVNGKYEAEHMETTSIIQKTDGSAEWDTKAIETTSKGDIIVVTGGGRRTASDPTSMKWEGELQYMTRSPRLAWLNGKKLWIEGSGNNIKGEIQAKAYEIK